MPDVSVLQTWGFPEHRIPKTEGPAPFGRLVTCHKVQSGGVRLYHMTINDMALQRTLIYDADCGFCTRSAMWISRGNRVNIKPWQGIHDLDGLGLTVDMVNNAAYWADKGQIRAAGESAIAHALIARSWIWKPLGYFILAVRPLSGIVYRYIAKNRHAMPGGTSACKLPPR